MAYKNVRPGTTIRIHNGADAFWLRVPGNRHSALKPEVLLQAPEVDDTLIFMGVVSANARFAPNAVLGLFLWQGKLYETTHRFSNKKALSKTIQRCSDVVDSKWA